MKVREDHIEQLRKLTAPLFTPEREKLYRDRGLSMKRYRWDALYAVWNADLVSLMNKIASRMQMIKDDHIDTVLRKLSGTK